MIRPDSIYGIGRITRTHGVNGKVELQFTDDVFDRADAPYLFLEMDGLPVPFFWEEYSFKNQHAALFKFEDVDNEQQARRLVGAQVFTTVVSLLIRRPTWTASSFCRLSCAFARRS